MAVTSCKMYITTEPVPLLPALGVAHDAFKSDPIGQASNGRTSIRMKDTILRSACVAAFVLAICLCGFARADNASGPVRVELKKTDSGWQLLRGGQPYFIKGAGGGDSRQLLAQLGGNSFRTW